MIRPLGTNLLIERDKAKNTTESGIILAGIQEDELETGTVIAIGEAVADIKEGDRVMFKSYSADVIEIEGKEQVFIREENILALV